MTCPKVSVVIVTYNAARDLRQTLENVSAQDYPALEIVVIDGQSVDDTPEVLAEFSDRIGVMVREPDKGIYDAMNKGLERATGEFVWFVNAGDRIHSSTVLRDMFGRFGTDGDLYYGETLIFSETGERLGLRKKKLPRELTWRSFRKGMVVCHQSVIVRKSVAPRYDLRYRYAADVEWVLLCLKNARKIVNTGRVLSEFVTGGVSTVHRKDGLKERYRIMRKYFGVLPTWCSHIRFVFDGFGARYRPYADSNERSIDNSSE